MRSYDFIFSLGGACSCSQSLRLADLQFASFPCDWLLGGRPSDRARGLVDGFEGWFDEAVLAHHEINLQLGHEPWINRTNGIIFKHDFDWNRPMSDILPAVREKYLRRLQRWTRLTEGARHALAIYISLPGQPAFDDAEFEETWRILSSRFPDSGLELLVLRCEKGRAFASRSERTEGPVRYVAWDYDDHRDFLIDNEAMAKYLSSELSVADYRTDEERRAWPARKRKLRYARYNATNFWEYFINRIEHRLYRHFKRRMVKKGLDRLGA